MISKSSIETLHTPAKKKGGREVLDINLQRHNYASRKAQPILSEYVIDPFCDSMKEKALKAAGKEWGFDENGILLEKDGQRYEWEKKVGDWNFITPIMRSGYRSYETIVSELETTLDGILHGTISEVFPVKKIEDVTYVDMDSLILEMERIRNKNTSWGNRQEKPRLKDKDKFTEEVESLDVYLDKRYSRMSPNNALSFLRADSLNSRLSGFTNDVEKWLMELEGVDPSGELEDKFDIFYNLENGTSVRLLFYPKTTYSYSEVYNLLLDDSNKNIARTSGDLSVIRTLSGGNKYENIRGKSGIRVESGEEGISITRIAQGKEDETKYRLLMEDKLYISVDDFLEKVRAIRSTPTTKNSPQLKIDYFPIEPESFTG